MPMLRESAPQLALKLRPGDAAAALRLAQTQLAQGKASQAASFARAAVRSEPLDVEALRTLGLALDKEGRDAEAAGVLGFAGRRSWRDGPTHLWLLKRRILSGDLQGGFKDADSLMRRAPESERPLFQLFVAAAADPRAIEPLAERLAARPPWRKDFLKALVQSPAGLDRAGGVYAALAATRAPPSVAEIGDYLRALAGSGRYDEAERQWRSLSPRTWSARRGGVSNGAFSGAPAPQPFGWTLGDGQSGSAAIEATGEPAHGDALHVIYDGYSRSELASQVLLLAPGAWRVTVAMHSAGLDAEASSLRWTVHCLGAGQASVGPASSATGAGGWRVLSIDVALPPQGCAAQALRLEPGAGERSRAADVWFDDVAVTPR